MLKTNHPLPIVVAVTLFLLLVGPSCRQRPMEEYGRRLERTDKAALHAVHSERLRQIMAELERLSLNQLPQEIDVGAERQRHIGQMSPVAQAMASFQGLLHRGRYFRNPVEYCGEKDSWPAGLSQAKEGQS